MGRTWRDEDATCAALTVRQRQLVAIVRGQGFATIEALARHFQVSPQTIRRDVIALDQQRLLQRFHGGAGVRENRVRLGYAQKRVAAAEAKERIGEAAAARIPEGASVFLDVGTTVEAVARALRGRRGLRVFTSSLPVATLLADSHQHMEIVVVGGVVRGADGSLVGDLATMAIGRFRVDLAVIGVSGFDVDGALMDFDLGKVAVKQAMMAAAHGTMVVADAGKFARSAVVRLASLDEVEMLVTDAAPPTALTARLEHSGVELILA